MYFILYEKRWYELHQDRYKTISVQAKDQNHDNYQVSPLVF